MYNSLRAFTTTAAQLAVPPESPNFVDVPQSYQPDLVIPRRQKGVLPVPRELFPPRQPDKPSEEYIARATRDKLAKNVVPESKMSELDKYRTRMALTRKKHLKEGLLELHNREEAMARLVAIRSEQKRKERERLVSQAERVDERLTNSSVPQAMKPGKALKINEADVEARYKKKMSNLEKQWREKAEERREALHTLYMNARTFITTDEQLDAEIEKAFPKGRNTEFATDTKLGDNIWNVGSPATIADLLDAGASRVRKDFSKAGLTETDHKFAIDQERMKRIAEELSGGKM
jgi:pyruvate-formate lyase